MENKYRKIFPDLMTGKKILYIHNPILSERIMAVIDYISGMTDIYALDIYQKINGISIPII